jgi:hypothetical protein
MDSTDVLKWPKVTTVFAPKEDNILLLEQC